MNEYRFYHLERRYEDRWSCIYKMNIRLSSCRKSKSAYDFHLGRKSKKNRWFRKPKSHCQYSSSHMWWLFSYKFFKLYLRNPRKFNLKSICEKGRLNIFDLKSYACRCPSIHSPWSLCWKFWRTQTNSISNQYVKSE